MRYFSVDVPKGVREFLGSCAHTNTLSVSETLNTDMFPRLKQTWEQWADGQDEDLYNNGSFMCAGVNVHTDQPFFVLGLLHAVWKDYCETVAQLAAQAIALNELDVLEDAVWENVAWEYAEQHLGRGQYTCLTVEGSALQVLIHSVPRSVLNNVLLRCQTHAVNGSDVHQWLEHQHAQRTHAAVSNAVNFSHKATPAKKM